MTKKRWHCAQPLCAILWHFWKWVHPHIAILSWAVIMDFTLSVSLNTLALKLFASSRCDSSAFYTVSLQPVMCGTWALRRWSPWRAARPYRKPPLWLCAPTLHQPPLWSTSKFPPRESPSLITRGSEYYRQYVAYSHHTFMYIPRSYSHINCFPVSF